MKLNVLTWFRTNIVCLAYFQFFSPSLYSSFSALLVLSRASNMYVSFCVLPLAFVMHDYANSSHHLVPPFDMGALFHPKFIYPFQLVMLACILFPRTKSYLSVFYYSLVFWWMGS